MSTGKFTCEAAKNLDLVPYLESLGFLPQKIRNNNYWYLSPLRNEKDASFKVNRKLNTWFDFGIGKGGNPIDFGILYHNCSVKELLEKLSKDFSFPQQNNFQLNSILADEKGKIRIINAEKITSLPLQKYLSERAIPVGLANQFCREVTFELHSKKHNAIGFQNIAGGYELRNKYFKGSSSPKDVTMIESGSKNITVFEGFTDFLSYHVLYQNQKLCLTNQHVQQTNFLVLNSLSFFGKSRSIMEKNDSVHLYLDRDNAGSKCTQNALGWNKKYIDQSHLYKNYKDLNEFLIQESKGQKQSRRLRIRF